jgi:ankyrin repeat protein
MRILMDRGADPNFADGPALVYAAYGGNLDAIRLLADHGADVNLADPNWFSPLSAGIRSCDDVQELLELGADPNRLNHEGQTHLYEAAVAGKPRIIKTLLQFGADRSRKNDRGETAYAIARRQLSPQNSWTAECLELLKPELTPGDAASAAQ